LSSRRRLETISLVLAFKDYITGFKTLSKRYLFRMKCVKMLLSDIIGVNYLHHTRALVPPQRLPFQSANTGLTQHDDLN